MSRRIYKRALAGVFRFAVNELLLLLFIVFSFAALRGVNSEAEAICLEEYPEGAAGAFGTACYNPPSIRVLYALAAVLVVSALVYSLRSFLRKPVTSVDDAYESAFDLLSPALKVSEVSGRCFVFDSAACFGAFLPRRAGGVGRRATRLPFRKSV